MPSVLISPIVQGLPQTPGQGDSSVQSVTDMKNKMGDMVSRLGKVVCQISGDADGDGDDIQQLAAEYRFEMEEMLKATAHAINSFNRELWDKQEDTRIQEVVEELSHRHEVMRLAALDDFQRFQASCEAAASAAKAESERHLTLMLRQVANLQAAVQSGQSELATLKQQSASRVQGLQSEVFGLQQSLAAARAETEEAVKTGNSHYMVLQAQRMQIEDELRAALANSALQLQQAEEASLQRSAEHKAAARCWQQEKHSLEREAATCKAEAEGIKANLESKLREQASLLQSHQDHIKALSSKLDEANRTQRELRSDYERAREETEAAREAEGLAVTRLSAIQAESAQLAMQYSSLQEQAVLQEQRCHSLQADVEAKRASLLEAERRIAQLEEEALQSNKQVLTLQAQAAAVMQAHADGLKGNTALQDKCMQQALALQDLGDQIGSLRADRDAARLEATQQASAVEALEGTVSNLQGKLRESATALASEQSVRQALEEALAAMRTAFEAEKQHHMDHIAAQKRDFEEASTAAQEKSRHEVEDNVAATTALWTAKLAKQISAHAEAINACRREAALLEANLAESQEREATQEARLSELAEDMHAQASAMTRALEERTLELQSSRAEAATLAEEKVSTEQALSHANEALSSLAGKLESLVEALADAESCRCQEVAAARAEGLRQVEEAVAASLKLSETHHTAALLQLRDELRSEASSERDRLLDKCTLDLQTCERDWTAKLAALEAQHAQQLVEVQGQQDAERDALHRRRSEELQLASMAHQDELHARAVEAEETLRRALTAKDEQHAVDMLRCQEQHAAYLEQRLAEAAQLHQEVAAADLASQRLELATRQAEATQRAQEAHACAMQELTKQHKAAIEQLCSQHSTMVAEHTRNLETKESAVLALTRKVESITGDFTRLQDEHVKLQQEKRRGEQAMTVQLREAQQEASMALAEQEQRHAQQTASLQALHATERAEADAVAQQASATAEERFASLQAAFVKLQKRFDARESRDEDLPQILHLKHKVKEQSQQIRTLQDNLEQMRAEILLREENYNKTFASGGAGQRVLAVNKALSAGNDVTNWMLKRSTSRAGQKSTRQSTTGGPRPTF